MSNRDWPLEDEVTAGVVNKLHRYGFSAWHFVATQYGRGGFPDILVLIPGRKAYLFELKTPEGRLSRRQSLTHQIIKTNTGIEVPIITIPKTGYGGLKPAVKLITHWLVKHMATGDKPWPAWEKQS